jgi:hypothetical protein
VSFLSKYNKYAASSFAEGKSYAYIADLLEGTYSCALRAPSYSGTELHTFTDLNYGTHVTHYYDYIPCDEWSEEFLGHVVVCLGVLECKGELVRLSQLVLLHQPILFAWYLNVVVASAV